MTPPFIDAAMPEVCARVAYQLVIIRWRKTRSANASGPETIGTILNDLDYMDGKLLHSCLLAAFYASVGGKRLAVWRTEAVILSRSGCGFRRCWYGGYKGPRRDPRVTNRGVTETASLE